jgi:peptidoglycan hydrolase CwlO-like protein
MSEILFATRERNIELSLLNDSLSDKVNDLENIVGEREKKIKMLGKKLDKVKGDLKKLQKKYASCLKFKAKVNKL